MEIRYEGKVAFSSGFRLPQVLRIVKDISEEYRSVVLLYATFVIDGEEEESATLFDKGKIVGVVTKEEGEKRYDTSVGAIFVRVGEQDNAPMHENDDTKKPVV